MFKKNNIYIGPADFLDILNINSLGVAKAFMMGFLADLGSIS